MAKFHVFIDTNIFLSFFAYTNDDIEELKKLVGLIKNKKVVLYLTQQTCREFARNRENKVLQAIADFSKVAMPGLPRLMAHYPDGDVYRKSSRTLKNLHAKLIAKAKEDALSEELPADKLFAELTKVAEIISDDEDDQKSARLRTERNDPPGKPGSFGDRLHWETLLANVPDKTDLHVISKDGDFSSTIDPSKPHPVLAKEWNADNGARLKLHSELGAFTSLHFPDIKLATDVEKRDAINHLRTSRSFAATHTAISKLSEFVDLLTAPEIDELVDLALENDQVRWIGQDQDVLEFFGKIVPSRWSKYAKGRRQELREVFGFTSRGELEREKAS